MSEPCPPGYVRALNGKCIKEITPPAPTLTDPIDVNVDEHEKEDED